MIVHSITIPLAICLMAAVTLRTPDVFASPHPLSATLTMEEEQTGAQEVLEPRAPQPSADPAVAREGASFNENASQVRCAGNFGDKPLIVLTAVRLVESADIGSVVTAKELDEFQQVWIHELQPRLARLSTRGKQILVPNSDHMIPEQAPRAVIDAVREVLQEVAKPGAEIRRR